jgi:hypothetical protein
MLDLVRRSLELRPHLRRIYICARNSTDAARTLEPLGFRTLEAGPPRLDGVPYHCYVLDLGFGSVDDWLAALAGDELTPATV